MPRVLFGWKPEWNGAIAANIDKWQFRFRFGRLDGFDPEGFDCVVPLMRQDYEGLAHWPRWQGRKFLAPQPSLVRLCHDKLSLNRHVLSGRFADLVPALDQGGGLDFPYILKKRETAWGMDTIVVRNPDEEAAAGTRLCDPDFFRQAYIVGDEEFALHMLIAEGRVLFHRTLRVRMPTSVYVRNKATPVLHAELLADSPHLAAFAPLMLELGYTGTCCIDYKLDRGRPMLMEINPRMGRSLVMAISDYLRAYLGALSGREPAREPRWKSFWYRAVAAADARRPSFVPAPSQSPA
jgi:carbamoylphosphate synthase large subunit